MGMDPQKAQATERYQAKDDWETTMMKTAPYKVAVIKQSVDKQGRDSHYIQKAQAGEKSDHAAQERLRFVSSKTG